MYIYYIYDNHQYGKSIMIVKTPGSHMGSPAAVDGGGEAMGWGRGER